MPASTSPVFSGSGADEFIASAMIAYSGNDNQALEAGIKYLVLSAVASAFMLLGYCHSLFVYRDLIDSGTGDKSTGPAKQWQYYPQLRHHLLLVAFTFKLSLVPCHLWVADVFEGAPVPTAALLATISKAALFVVLLRLSMFGEWHINPQSSTSSQS